MPFRLEIALLRIKWNLAQADQMSFSIGARAVVYQLSLMHFVAWRFQAFSWKTAVEILGSVMLSCVRCFKFQLSLYGLGRLCRWRNRLYSH